MNTKKDSSNFGPVVIIGILFFIFGFITWLNATLIPYLKIACELQSDFQSFFVTFAFYISYFVMAIPSSWVLKKTGFKNGMSLGLAVMAIGALIFIPAAYSRTFSMFLLGLFVQGTGLAILQTASNPYVTILGPIESAAKRISIMGIANKVAGILSPIILGAIILSGTDTLVQSMESLGAAEKAIMLDGLSEKVIFPYIIMAISLFILALVIRFSGLPEVEQTEEETEPDSPHKKRLLQHRNLVFGVIAIFLYVGVEVISVDTLIAYGTWSGYPMSEAKFFASITLFAMILGYIIGIVSIPRFISQERALALCAVLSLFFVTGALIFTGFVSVLFIALLGLSNSLMWPAIWPLAIKGLGKFTKIGSALLIMGIAGGAVLPLVYGYFSDLITNHYAYWIMLPCYAFILFYATLGHKIKSAV